MKKSRGPYTETPMRRQPLVTFSNARRRRAPRTTFPSSSPAWFRAGPPATWSSTLADCGLGCGVGGAASPDRHSQTKGPLAEVNDISVSKPLALGHRSAIQQSRVRRAHVLDQEVGPRHEDFELRPRYLLRLARPRPGREVRTTEIAAPPFDGDRPAAGIRERQPPPLLGEGREGPSTRVAKRCSRRIRPGAMGAELREPLTSLSTLVEGFPARLAMDRAVFIRGAATALPHRLMTVPASPTSLRPVEDVEAADPLVP